VAVLIILLVPSYQGSEDHPATPVQVVQRYCEFDSNVGRISSANFAKLPSLTTWDEEPGWDTVTVISGFKVISSKQSQGSAVVTVRWNVLGYSEAENVTKQQKAEIVSYKLRRVKGQWKIESPILQPHVSLTTVRTFVVDQFKKEPQRQALWIRNLDALAAAHKIAE
jgi:hypothetical protein